MPAKPAAKKVSSRAAGRPARKPRIHPDLWFDDDLEEALAFYTTVFPGSKVLHRSYYGDAGPGPKGTLMYAQFELAGNRLGGVNGGPVFRFTEAVSLVIDCKDQDEVDYYWQALTADGGQESQCGWLKDRFGLSWQVVPRRLGELLQDKDEARAQRAMAAMLTMRKLDVAALEAAADGRAPGKVAAGKQEARRIRADTEAAAASSRKKR